MATSPEPNSPANPDSNIIGNNTIILRSLTAENPHIYHGPDTTGPNTRSSAWVLTSPQLLRPWKDFTISTFKTIFQGQLLGACVEDVASSPNTVILSEDERTISNEDSCRDVYLAWNREQVNWAMGCPPIKSRFNPAFWRNGEISTTIKAEWGTTPPPQSERASRRIASKPPHDYNEGKKNVPLRPDTGAGRNLNDEASPPELLPIEYKVATRWDSKRMFEKVVTEEGEWKDDANMFGSTLSLPINQIFAYCVSTGCRYGCLLTTKEAFLVRVRPIDPPDGKTQR